MNFGVAELMNELKALRKGFGVESADLPARLGPALRTVCGVAAGDTGATVRRKVSAALTGLIGCVPDDLGRLSRTALGLGGLPLERYQRRVERLAERLERDPRTVQRRIDDALRRVAELAVDGRACHQSVQRGVPWHTIGLRVAVLLDQPVIEVLETRHILAHRPDLAEIDDSVTISPPADWNGSLDPADLGVDVVSGGVLHSPRLVAPNRFGFRLRLPRPLGHGEEGEFSLRIKVNRPFAPHFVCTPWFPCQHFNLVVRFGPDRVPPRIWLLDNVFPLELADPWPQRPAVEANAAGEARAAFTDLEPHRSYGLGWEPLPDRTSGRRARRDT